MSSSSSGEWNVFPCCFVTKYLHEIREMLDMKVIQWPPVYVINKRDRLEVPDCTNVFGGVEERLPDCE